MVCLEVLTAIAPPPPKVNWFDLRLCVDPEVPDVGPIAMAFGISEDAARQAFYSIVTGTCPNVSSDGTS